MYSSPVIVNRKRTPECRVDGKGTNGRKAVPNGFGYLRNARGSKGDCARSRRSEGRGLRQRRAKPGGVHLPLERQGRSFAGIFVDYEIDDQAID
jgi:hypothetical protein